MLSDIPKDVVFAKILFFSNIFGSPAVNWAPKWNKTVSFRCLLCKLKFKILDFQILRLSYRRQPLVQIATRLNNIWGSKYQKKNTKRGHFMDAKSIKKFEHF